MGLAVCRFSGSAGKKRPGFFVVPMKTVSTFLTRRGRIPTVKKKSGMRCTTYGKTLCWPPKLPAKRRKVFGKTLKPVYPFCRRTISISISSITPIFAPSPGTVRDCMNVWWRQKNRGKSGLSVSPITGYPLPGKRWKVGCMIRCNSHLVIWPVKKTKHWCNCAGINRWALSA